jgi:hypothetical protein
MSAHPATPGHGSSASSLELGVKLVTLAGVGLVGYGVIFLIRNSILLVGTLLAQRALTR